MLEMHCHLVIIPEEFFFFFFLKTFPLQTHLRKSFSRTMRYKFRLQVLSHVSLLVPLYTYLLLSLLVLDRFQCVSSYEIDYETEQGRKD